MQPTPEQSGILDHNSSILTLHSRRTGRRYTYRITRAPLTFINFYYIDLLDGPTNEDTVYPLGRIEGMHYYPSRSSPIPATQESNLAFAFFWRNIQCNRIHPDLEIIPAKPVNILDSDAISW